ncbi:arginine--tRNA ligase [Sphingopyxis sp. H038]|uniref:arginine--tRNA ligase n=1 Tax=unclassified Sphingopyxis TaxID=2614943 RepID=UPI0007317C2C|nr:MULTISPECIES: arginine--tRNA ligase [unclassified Sphingopyxis]KTE02140.1 arginine--tRNA ligase [Sphingopyxis sp. H012]KTE09889.1 arginine--tRNA ligase [Sphingopyxis sp. H053]KTE15286.1 arginine--tRNA ligase [Sphingopyxis sp. H093]KTE29993.1 arginine--tRNA ligase [Sphingopyxis sp. H080]KTE33667.1 arginine--tRNA ligase [Sphingopyxis sp. H038]
MTLFSRFSDHIGAALDALAARDALPGGLDRGAISVEPPRDPAHGDVATNAAMVLAKPAGMNPRALADLLVAELGALGEVTEASVAGPGFINLRLVDDSWRDELALIFSEGGDYGRSTIGQGRRVNVEYVSANPTGPMHVGHCRGAVVGDALAALLEYAGHEVIREYYINDAGAQVDVLARSVHMRYREALGEDIGAIPEGLYPGDYLMPIAGKLAAEYGERFVGAPESAWLGLFRAEAVSAMMDMIRADLAKLGIHHDLFSSEAELQAEGKPAAAEKWLRDHDLVYDGQLEAPKGETPEDWEPVELPLFRSTQFGDDQDRPIKKSDGSWTYFGADLAYHFQKSRNADELIDIWGADHAGTVKRIKAAVAALTGGKTRFDVKLVQMVRLLKNGEPFKMSKRAGNFVTLADVVDEVGKDAVRFTMLTRKADAQMDFDFAKVVEASRDNPVWYLQYANARISRLRKKAADAGIVLPEPAPARLNAHELGLVKLLAQFPRIVEAAASAREPHRIAFYLADVAAAFHAWYNLGNDDPSLRIVLDNDPELTATRLYLADGIGQVIRNGLSLMGVEALEEMN